MRSANPASWKGRPGTHMNLRPVKVGHMARTSVDQGDVSIFRFYKKIKMGENDLQTAEDANDIDHSILRDWASVVRGASWFGAPTFYFPRFRGKCASGLLLFAFRSPPWVGRLGR